MGVFTKPMEYLTTDQYLRALPEIPFAREDEGYIKDLVIFEIALRKWQRAWARYCDVYIHYEYESPEALDEAKREERELFDLLVTLEDEIKKRWGLDDGALKRDADLLRDKRQIGVM